MLKQLMSFFTEEADKKPADKYTLDLSAAALMVEVMKADHYIDNAERKALKASINELFDLSEDDVLELMAQAEGASDQSVDLFKFTEVVHAHFSVQQKYDLMVGLWRVAYASDGIDKYEEHIIRRIADLLYIPHSEFIRAKQLARPDA
ncbi:tellurite resistance TerB family protein [Oceanobacter kriegii]|uniref:tellurite resistance TerB family protein n=1 Tax=Oceanobacter kriegii TaxID=64972 RepID=UPI0003F93198|nr:TerB family tellurite resistance protein [Oceanobacter kriegii]